MMMLRTGDLNLNHLAQAFGDSVEGLKQAMLQHEIIFRNQVRELHRLYWTQKNLMREVYRRESDEYAVRSSSKAEEFLLESNSRAVGFMLGGNVGVPDEFKGKFIDSRSSQQRSFSLQLPADECIRNDRGKIVREKSSIGDEFLIGPETARPNCSTGEAIFEKGGINRSLFHGENNLYCHEIIDLEESVETESHSKANGSFSSAFKAPADRGAGISTSQSTIPSDMFSSSRVKSESGLVPSVLHLHAGYNERWQEKKLTHNGAELGESCAAAFIDLSSDSTQKLQSSYKPMLIDLNIPQNDEYSHVFNDPVPIFPSSSSSSTVNQYDAVWIKPGDRCPKESSAAQKIDTLCPAANISRETNSQWLFPDCQSSQSLNVTEICQNHEHEANNKVQRSDTESQTEYYRNSVEQFSSGSNGGVPSSKNGTNPSSTSLCNQVEDKANSIAHSDSRRQASVLTSINNLEDSTPLPASVGSTNLPPSLTGDSEGKQANNEGSEEDTVSSHAIDRDEKQQDGLVKIFSVGSMSNHITGNSDCSLQDKCVSDSGTTTQLDYPAAKSFPSSQASIPKVSNHAIQGQSCRSNPEEHTQDQAAATDCMIASAAEAIVQISLAKPSSPVDRFHGTGPIDIENEEDKSDQPQYSSDSFESMTLKLPEVSNEHLMPTRSTEKEVADDQSGVKNIRRGRGRGI